MRVFITGSTGFVGQEIIHQAHKSGHSLRILVRNSLAPTVREIAATTGAEIHQGDVMEPQRLAGSLGGVQAIIHLVGIISEVGPATFENIHTQGTGNMVAASQRAGVKRFLHMSALGTRAGAVSRYHQSKWAAEEIVRQSGLDYSIFRPSLIYGSSDHFVNLFAQLAKFSPVLPIIGRKDARFQPIGVDMVARAFVQALNEPRAIGQTYDLCGLETMTLPQLLDQILAVIRRKRWKLQIPPVLARPQAALLEFVYGRMLKKAPPLNRDQLRMLQEDNVGDGSKAEELFNLTHRPFKEGISYLTRKNVKQNP